MGASWHLDPKLCAGNNVRAVTKPLACRLRGRKTAAGFSLVEVLVALTVLAIALAAVTKTASEGAGNAAYLRDKTLGNWVAMNKITELYAMNQWPPIGQSNGDSPMGGHEWVWTMEVSATPDQDIRRVEVEVRRHEDDAGIIVSRVAFLPKPRGRAGASGG